jgi:hypothetical protein
MLNGSRERRCIVILGAHASSTDGQRIGCFVCAPPACEAPEAFVARRLPSQGTPRAPKVSCRRLLGGGLLRVRAKAYREHSSKRDSCQDE